MEGIFENQQLTRKKLKRGLKRDVSRTPRNGDRKKLKEQKVEENVTNIVKTDKDSQ